MSIFSSVVPRPFFLAALLSFAALGDAAAPDSRLPDALKPWAEWATWGDKTRDCPALYSDSNKRLCFWPSRLELKVERGGGSFELAVTVYHETWVPLPGNAETWPLEVKAGAEPIAVVEHEGAPAVKLPPGVSHLTGVYRWSDVPQRLPVPAQIGILALTLDGQPVEAPVWDAQGFLWLKRDSSTEEADKNFLSVKLYAALEDGIPLWLRTEIELTASGKSREEELGTILPEGWKLASVESSLPVAIDDAGRMKVQVRAGKWTIRADAFRFDNPKELRYAAGAKPPIEEELIAFRARPDFRIVDVTGAPSIDVSQTTFPEKWRELPVYRWEPRAPIRLEERMRGMGDQKPAGLTIQRELWLDEDGRGLTFRDTISGQMQQIWRLDAAPGQGLGSVRSGGQGQLITRNPQTGAPGVEVRTRDLNLEATGRLGRTGSLPATGWKSDADSLRATLNLPPGWRLFALFGADWVQGDWLTAWTLLDLFLLLIFTLAVFRLWGWSAALLAFVALGLSFHEPGAPRYLWLVLLVPLALLRVVPAGSGRRVVQIAQCLALALFLFALVPFVWHQVQQALYPQLERITEGQLIRRGLSSMTTERLQTADQELEQESINLPAATPSERADSFSLGAGLVSTIGKRSYFSKDNLNYDAKARIQTGPGVPEWHWRAVSFGWNGPVSAAQQVRPVLIPVGLERALAIARVLLLLLLAAVLLGARRIPAGLFRPRGAVAALLFIAFTLASASAQAPDKATLDTLRERLLEPSDAFPHAAELPTVSLSLNEGKLTIEAELHAAVRTAVPLPGRLPAWSPLRLLVDEQPEAALRREDGYLWVVLEPGVHRVRIEGFLAHVTEWEWTFLLKPRQVKIDAPGWSVTGVRPGGVPEAQVFFVRKAKAAAGAASYDRQEVQSIAQIDRQLELGLIWGVTSTVTRLSPVGKAVALNVPLLPGESVLSSNAIVKDGFIEVRLGAQETAFTWESSLPVTPALPLATRSADTWVERWHLVASPIWNVAIGGLPPVFEPGKAELVPAWQPWPGESVALAISRPEAIAGATVTVSRGTHTITLGQRQRTSKLELSLRCSLGEDFLIELPAEAEVTALTHNGKAIPVRKDGAKLVIPLKPGEQKIELHWKTGVALGVSARAEEVRLPVESANLQTVIIVPDARWVLWADGPRRGPAVRFWGILICSLLAGLILGRLAFSPLRAAEWMLLMIGLTQVPLAAALVVVAWLFLLAWRGQPPFQRLPNTAYNFAQAAILLVTAVALGVLLKAVGAGLLGHPDMFITGNGSTRTALRWFQARNEGALPRPGCLSISIWWYRFFMLAWALWLAAALLRWLRRGWLAFSSGGTWRQLPKPAAPAPKEAVPPPNP